MKNSTPDLSACERLLCYRFANIQLLKKALTHSSYSTVRVESNERLEFLGDAALGLAVSNLLYRRFPQMTEGELSRIKGSIVSRKTCRRVASRLELDHFLFLGKGIDAIPGSLVSNVLESVVGAIFIDGGYEEARLFIEEKFQPEIDAFFHPANENSDAENDASEMSEKPNVLELDGNFKEILQTRLHREKPGVAPIYVPLDEKGPPHRRCFKIAVQVGNRQFQAAWGNSKKETEQRAAENALRQLNGETPVYPDGD